MIFTTFSMFYYHKKSGKADTSKPYISSTNKLKEIYK